MKEGITFNDVLLVPKKSRVFSRKDINTKTELSRNIKLNTPLVSANMDTVTESEMAREMAKLGGIGIIHRFLSIEKQVKEVKKVKRSENIIIDDPFTTKADKKIKELAKELRQENISSALVVNIKKGKKYLIGIITARDFLFEANSEKKVSDLMTKNVITTNQKISIKKAKEIFHKNKIEKLPIIKKDGELLGLITLSDIIKKINNPNASKDKKGRLLVGAAIGVKEDFFKRAKALKDAGADVIVIDIAHGHNSREIDALKKLKKIFKNEIDIIAGNIATKEAALDLIKAGADGLKVGIGPGAACTTRIVTGVGVPQITAIKDVMKVAQRYKIPVIADGGIKNSGDFSKALAAGASSAMIGNLLAGCKESPGEYIIDRGMIYKYYRGMASFEAASDKKQIDKAAPDGLLRVPEGASGKVYYKGDASMVITDLVSGLRSSMSYLGAKNLKEFSKNAEFIKITNAGMIESGPHGV